MHKNKGTNSARMVVSEIVLQMLHDMQNGSITIVKQDNTVIQINTHQITCFGKQAETDDFAEVVLL